MTLLLGMVRWDHGSMLFWMLGELYGKDGPLSQFRGKGNGSPIVFHDILYYSKAQAGPTGLGGEFGLKDPVPEFLGNAHAVVGHGNDHLFPLAAHGDQYSGGFHLGHRLYGIL